MRVKLSVDRGVWTLGVFYYIGHGVAFGLGPVYLLFGREP